MKQILCAVLAGLVGMGFAAADDTESPLSADTAATEAVTVDQAASDSENWRMADPENLIVFNTSKGQIIIEMLPAVAPAHAEQFRAIVRSGDYAGTLFHRVIQGFMAQGGDIFAIKGRESGLPNIPAEFTFRRDPKEMPIDPIGPADAATNGYYMGFPMRTQAFWLAEMSKDGRVDSYIPHCPGVVSTARTDDPNSGNSQFFLMRGTSPHLDKEYTAWGRVVSGQAVVMELKIGEPPANPDVLQSASMAADLAADARPTVYVQRTDGPAFAERLAQQAEADEWNVCNFPPVATVIDAAG